MCVTVCKSCIFVGFLAEGGLILRSRQEEVTAGIFEPEALHTPTSCWLTLSSVRDFLPYSAADGRKDIYGLKHSFPTHAYPQTFLFKLG